MIADENSVGSGNMPTSSRGGVLNKTPQYYQGAMGKGVVLDVNGDGAPDIAGTTTIGVSRLLNTGHK